jgi:hypothetical protein
MAVSTPSQLGVPKNDTHAHDAIQKPSTKTNTN